MKRVLLVDDAAFMRLSLKKMLERNGYEIVGEADNGEKAITQYEVLKPDIVTMDITMREMDGIEATKRIKALDQEANIIMVSAMGQESFVREAVVAGAKGFIVKPFTEEKVLEAFRAL